MTESGERLRAAYEAAVYRVDEGPRGRFMIRVGERSADVDALLAEAGADSWAFITAANPRSVRLTAGENAARAAALANVVAERRLVHFAGTGGGAEWPAEPSLLVLGIAEADAKALASAFDQHAILFGQRGGAARLVWVEAAS